MKLMGFRISSSIFLFTMVFENPLLAFIAFDRVQVSFFRLIRLNESLVEMKYPVESTLLEIECPLV